MAILGVLSLGRGIPFPRCKSDSWTVSPDEGRIGRLQRCSSVTTLTSEKLPDEDNDDEKHDD